MSRSDLISQAYRCIDEVYPDTADGRVSGDLSAFHVEEFLEEAARWVVQSVPLRVLGAGTDGPKTPETYDNGGGKVILPKGFQRLLSFKMSDWDYAVVEAYDQMSPKYKQQANAVLRGTPSRPIVFLCNGSTELEYFTTKATAHKIDVFKVFVLSKVDDSYPVKLYDITAWKTAELVLSAMNDLEAVQVCQMHVKEILQTL